MNETLETLEMKAQPLTPEAFAPFGVALVPMEDGTPFTEDEAVLDLSAGTPRFYLMSLEDKPLHFTRITRHLQTTQTLMALGGAEWFIAVAPAGDLDVGAVPALDDIRVFRVSGDVAITLRKGTWHSGPYFEADALNFANVELSDTNAVDHHTYRLDEALGVRVAIDAA